MVLRKARTRRENNIMHKVGLYEARQELSELVRRAGQGEVIGITKRGKFLAILTPPSQREADINAAAIRKDAKKRGR
jgi:prevent-host-death family protein